MSLTVAIRVDASSMIGSGHVMRCLTLALALRERGHQVQFICRALAGNLIGHIQQAGFVVHILAPPTLLQTADEPASWLGVTWPEDAAQTLGCLPAAVDWLVVDHYSLDVKWEQQLRARAQRLLVIDDLANRAHDCELLLDQNLGRLEKDYEGFVSKNATCLIGTEYVLLRDEFKEYRAEALVRRRHCSNPKRLFISLGGVDRENITGRLLEVINVNVLKEIEIDVVLGSQSPWYEDVYQQLRHYKHPVRILKGVTNMAELMTAADFAIGAAGSTSWERCCLGLPSAMIVLADNQRVAAQAIEQVGAGVSFNRSLNLAHQVERFLNCLSSPVRYLEIASIASTLVDGMGVEKVIAVIEGACND